MCQNRWEPIACDLLPEEKKTTFRWKPETRSEEEAEIRRRWGYCLRKKSCLNPKVNEREGICLQLLSKQTSCYQPVYRRQEARWWVCIFFLSVAPCVCLQPPLPPPRAPLLLLIFFVRRCEVVMSFHPGTVSCVETDLLCKPLRELLGQEERISSEKFPQNLNARRRSRRVPQKC